MEQIQLQGRLMEVEGSSINVLTEEATESKFNSSCSGKACADIDYQFDEDTQSYHFFNDGNKKVRLKVVKATYFGCTAVSKTRNMRPGDEWDSGFFGFCNYVADYR